MKRIGLIILVSLIGLPLFSFEVVPLDEAMSFSDLEFILTHDEQQSVDAARLYFMPKGMDRTVYIDYQLVEGQWSVIIPARFVPDKRLEYFVEIRDDQGRMHRIPEEDMASLDILPYDIPPQVELTYPQELSIAADEQHMLVFRVSRHVGIDALKASFEDRDVEFIDQREGWITLQLRPRSAGQQALRLEITDAAGNVTEEQFLFMVFKPEITPWFTSSYDWYIEADASYSGTGVWEPEGDTVHRYEDEYPLSLAVGNYLHADLGPVSLSAGLSFLHEDTPLGMVDSVPDVLTADLFDILHLWHPWNFEQEFSYSAERVRAYDGGLLFFTELSLFDDVLVYQFGDQSLTFQDYTVSNVNFRGTSAALELPFISFRAAKGLTDMGLYQMAWPQQFVGFQTGLGWKEYFQLQTNISLFTDFQGRYDEIRGGSSTIKALYDLEGIAPKQNLVLGVGISSETSLLSIAGNLGFSIYTDNISNVIDVKELAETIVDLVNENADDNGTLESSDLDPYFEYLDRIQNVFPVLDYFPLNLGLVDALISGRGMVYNLEVDIKPLDLDLFFYKADGSYRSLGAPAASDVMKVGASWKGKLNDISTDLTYTYERNAIPDILVYDILRRALSGDILEILMSLTMPEEDNEPKALFIQEGNLKLSTPRYGNFGSYGLGYRMKYEYSQDFKTFIAFASDDDIAFTHTAEASWNSGAHRFGSFRVSLDVKGSGDFNQEMLKDGEKTSGEDWYWNFKYSINPRFDFGNIRTRFSYEQSWSQLQDAFTVRTYKGSVRFPLLHLIDDVTISTEISDIYDSAASLTEREFDISLSLKHAVSLLNLEARANMYFIDDRIQGSIQDMKGEYSFTVAGGISF